MNICSDPDIHCAWMNELKAPFLLNFDTHDITSKNFHFVRRGDPGGPRSQNPTTDQCSSTCKPTWAMRTGWRCPSRRRWSPSRGGSASRKQTGAGVAWRPRSPRSSTPHRCTRSRSSTRPVDMRSPCVEQWMHMVTSSLQVWLNNGAKQAGNWGTFANWKPPVSISEGSSVSSGPGGWGRGERDQRGAAAGSSSSSAQRWF